MSISLHPSALRRTRWYEYMSRFVIGGATTAAAGLIAKEFGPGVGGLFLAFPAIFPATATLIEKHEKERKREAGGHGTVRGRKAAALDAAGAMRGAAGLLVFAAVLGKLLPHFPWAALLVATLAWLIVSMLAWKLRRL
jgi:Protein of unknown function (DUF3147)